MKILAVDVLIGALERKQIRLILLDLSKEYQRLGGSIATCSPLMAYPCPPFREDPHLRFSLGHRFPFSFELATIDPSRSRIPVSNRKCSR
jgi:hypothetical protein